VERQQHFSLFLHLSPVTGEQLHDRCPTGRSGNGDGDSPLESLGETRKEMRRAMNLTGRLRACVRYDHVTRILMFRILQKTILMFPTNYFVN